MRISRIVQHVVILSVLTCIQVECIFSSSGVLKARGRSRSQSMRPFVHKKEFNLNTRAASTSSSSSASSATSLADQKVKPIQITSKVQPSTSTVEKQKSKKSCNHDCFKDVNLQPIVAEVSSPVRSFSGISLHEAMQSTHSGGQINPSRDGMRARIRKILKQHSVPVGVGMIFGSAIGVGTLEEVSNRKKNLSSTSNDISTTTSTTIITTSTMQPVDDEIKNQI